MNWFLLLPFFAVVLGYILASVFKKQAPKSIKLLLAFSGAFLLSTVAHEMLPEIYNGTVNHIGLYIIAGVFIQILLEFFSRGAEHGHLHIDKNASTFPYVLYASLCIHAFLEGMPVQDNDTLLYGIAIHKLPIAFIFSSFLMKSSINVYKSVLLLLLFALMSPVGSIIASAVPVLFDYMTPIKAVVAGIILHVSTTLILEANENHKFNVSKIVIMILGAGLAFML